MSGFNLNDEETKFPLWLTASGVFTRLEMSSLCEAIRRADTKKQQSQFIWL